MSDYEEDINIESDVDEYIDDMQNEDDDMNDSSDYETYEETSNNSFDNNIRIHNNFLNIYEITVLVGYRANQISNGSRSFLEEDEAKSLCNPLLIAEEEFKRGLIPFDIIRHINVGKDIKNVCLDVGKDLHILDVGNMV